MTEKIIFWLNAYMLFFGLAHNLQKKYDCEQYAIIDITNRTKKFFEEQNLVDFTKIWFLHDHIQNSKNIDIEYLKNFEKKYSINLWELGINERLFYQYNDFYQFSQDEILSILEKECKLYESILDEIKPDFLITSETALHQQHLFYKMCRKKGIKVLMLNQSKLAYKCIISQELHELDEMPLLSDIPSQGRTFDELLKILTSKDNSKQLKLFEKSFGGNTSSKVKAASDYFLKSDNSNTKTHFSYYGRKKSKVFLDYISKSIKTKKRKSFIDKNLEFEVHNDEKYILFTLHQEPERSLLIATPFYTNQLEVIRHIAKSIPPGYLLYVKEHFSQSLREWREISYYKEILKIPNVRLYHPSSNIQKLIENSSFVISIGGTVSLEAAFYQKPSIIMSDMGFSILPSVSKINSLDELPVKIREGLDMKINPDDLDRYLSVLDEHSFELDLKEYEINEANFFRHGGNFHDSEITNQKMQLFLENSKMFFETLTKKYIEKIQKFKEKKI